MKNILEDLWYGNISPSDSIKTTIEARELRKELSLRYDNLVSSLNKEQRKLFEDYDECNIDLCDVTEREIFKYAFCLGMCLAIESLK